MVTYNHEKFIRQAIESVMEQETDFPFLLIIGEDCSTDSTRDICIELNTKYPDKIQLILNDKNLGVSKNARQLHEACYASGSKYIAILEGDDYWNNPKKLQKQVDFLEKNEDFSVCFHRVQLLTNDQISLGGSDDKDAEYTIEDFAKGNKIPTLSVLYRNPTAYKLPDWFWQCSLGDYALHMINGTFGKYKYFSEPMAVYRHHSDGLHSMKTYEQQIKMLIQTINVMKHAFKPSVKQSLENQVNIHYENLIRQAYVSKNYVSAKSISDEAVIEDPNFKIKLLDDILPSIIRDIHSTNRYKIGDKVVSTLNKLKIQRKR